MSRYSYQSKTTSSSQQVNSRKSTSLLKDNSWINRNDEEDEDVDRDPNFGRSVLSQYKTGDTVTSSDGEETKTTTTISKSSSVHALSKRFSGQYDTPSSSTLPSSRSSSTYSRSSRTSVTEEPKTSTTTTTFSNDGNTTETTTITTTQSVRSPTKTDTFSERVLSSSKGYSSYSPTRTTKVTETTLSSNDAEDKLFDTLIPSSIKDDYSPTDSRRSFSTTETVTVRSSSDVNAEDNLYDTLIPKAIKDGETESRTTVTSSEWRRSSTNEDIAKTTRSTRTSSSAEDGLYDTLLPMGIKSPTRTSSVIKTENVTVDSSTGDESPTLSSPSYSSRVSRYSSSYGDDSPTTRTTSYTISSKPSEDYSSKTYSYSSRSDDNMGDSVYSRSSSTKSVYAPPERTVLERDMCSSCRKPFTGDAKMVLDDMRINCHANCFKCEVCNCSLGHLKAGDIMWIYKRMVHCENCFEVTRDKWRR